MKMNTSVFEATNANLRVSTATCLRTNLILGHMESPNLQSRNTQNSWWGHGCGGTLRRNDGCCHIVLGACILPKKSTSEDGFHWEAFHPLTLPTNMQHRLLELSKEEPLFHYPPPPQSTLSCSTLTTCTMTALYPQKPENLAILHPSYYQDITLYDYVTHLNLSLLLVMPRRNIKPYDYWNNSSHDSNVAKQHCLAGPSNDLSAFGYISAFIIPTVLTCILLPN